MTSSVAGPKYRPARIQTLTADQEIVLKQVWAYFFKYFGYPLDIDKSDLPFKECFIASTSTQHFDESHTLHPLIYVPTRTAASITSRKTTGSTRSRRSMFSGRRRRKSESFSVEGVKPPRSRLPHNSKRMVQIQTQSSFERYVPVDVASDEFYYTYAHHYKRAFEYSDDYKNLVDADGQYIGSVEEETSSQVDELEEDGDMAGSVYSLETFVTAASSFTDEMPVHKPKKNPSIKAPKRAVYNLYNGGRIKPPGKFPHPSFITMKINNKITVQPVDQFKRTMNMHHTVRHDRSLLSCFRRYEIQSIHTALNTLLRHDLLDNFVLRFIRARKWDTEKAIAMLTKTLDWRINEFPADNWVMEGDAPSYLKGINQGFVKNFTKEKSWIKGRDKNNNPIFTFQARKHLTTDASVKQNQRYAVVMIEWARLILKDVSESVDTFTILFDLTGFSLKNADYSTIKFLADCLEAHYPETLGFILIHNAPWIFASVWNIIKHWIDPLVAEKIHFTKDLNELTRFIDIKAIPDYLGGQDPTRGRYPIPTARDAFPPKRKDAEYIRLMKERDQLYCRFYETTKKWIESTNPAISELYLKDKLALDIELAKNYVLLDPYIRNPGLYDRDGTLTMSI
ncbi:uncharacterized protein SPAPADRAFT_50787 [Spathaspora passalidarum NRRL Y-27907]|uniref:CRAL-TRIO domain-containing protein n=1 Tax=Spathaspora passalidarum (strain NRRL Y-27907 / 11-Y1) TaxID=619300 RepID=G3APP3_SPAPN|nr:uncharacterized protein SPAPADRAFT_50787 [Spathaspora passalidarum NRRL Y-27907]EGW32214.1 hypothetical protein SPAPADRAFT_50787 [Spathaspora passalidarum NRRL Y-27907]